VTNYAEVDLVSTRFASARSLDESEEISIAWKIPGRADAGAHVSGFVMAWFVVEHLGLGRALGGFGHVASVASAAAIYYAVAFVWTAAVLGRRLSPDQWRRRLNLMRLVVPGAADPEALRTRLDALRARLVWREACALALVVGAAFAILSGETLPGTGMPLALVVVGAAAVFAMNLERFAHDVHGVLLARGVSTNRFAEFSLPEEPSESRSVWDRVREATSSRLALVLTILIVLVKLIQFLGEALALWRGADR
jgi:hypothetical protein